MADEPTNRQAFRQQAAFCAAMDAPITARVCEALADALSRDGATGRRTLDWPGDPIPDALPLRLVGGLHALARSGIDPELTALFAGEGEPQAILRRVLVEHDAALLPWLDGPPQTNEPMRSGVLMAGLLEVAKRHGPAVELLEIGSSAGLNLLIDRYRFDLGGTTVGPEDAPVTIRPEWNGPPPPAVLLHIASVRGVDIQPLDATDPAIATRLAGYIWADQPERQERLAAAIAMQRARPVDLVQGDAVDWLRARLAEPQAAGVTRVLMHSVVWQYLGDARRAAITAMIDEAAARATSDRPLAWVRMEPDRVLQRQELIVQSWLSHGDRRMLATAHAHGAWIAGV
ncbi:MULTISPECIES: DUF2332 domain-containing protein [Sphingomonas]|jgi:hypothetical protein|uniref:DUF2332 domain-containing protein n=1 Tax=Sphingomonas hankookensis TaxID=563996 RepID=A0ABR5Y888_9SPHN|nr:MULTISPECIES: DUF2332 domain-containing protein [Sphingomonas]KZE08770.1 hypothetical protein AVT10_07565 [Sphingomonas hankookensis]PZT95810.1 MAG: DUF2332 domain-containing protein [Sphingomonas sp.]RSV27812.1 DUF2332 domain-containing protein [Sphingomonas sp. ABOLH]WCP72898.1 DUF2332 domain-containing protein [Sphingomonas hankookensis]